MHMLSLHSHIGLALLLLLSACAGEGGEGAASAPTSEPAAPPQDAATEVDTASRPDTTSARPDSGFTVQIALLDYAASGDRFTKESGGERRGCDRVVMVDRNVPRTQATLTAAMNELFSLDEFEVDGWQHFIAETNETLSFDRATVSDGLASVYLSGELSGLGGTCDDPRAMIQIEETALQFSTVDSVAIYLDGERTDLRPDARGE